MLFRNSVFCGAGEHNPDNYQLSEKNTEFDKPFLVYSVLFLWLLSDYCSDVICHVTKHNMTDQSILSIRWEKWVLMKFSIYKPFSVDPRPALVLHFLPVYFAPVWFRESWNKFRQRPSGETFTCWFFQKEDSEHKTNSDMIFLLSC